MKLVNTAGENLSRMGTSLSRISALFSMRALEFVSFHEMDDEFNEGRLDPRYLPSVRRSVELTSPELFPAGLRGLASTLQGHLSNLEAALMQNDLENARSESQLAHESYHTLQRGVSEWLG